MMPTLKNIDKDGTSSKKTKGPGTFQTLIILARYHGRLFAGVRQDINLRYTGSIFGVAWAFLFPITQLAIYAMLYVLIFRIRVPGLTQAEYVLLVFSGLVALFAFNEMLTTGLNSLQSNKSLLMSTVFPAELIPVRGALVGQVPMLLGMVVTLVYALVLGNIGWQAIIIIPYAWLMMTMFAVGLSWILSLLSLVAKDIQHGIGLILMLTTFLSPFAYTPEMVPAGLKLILYFNPLSYFVLCFQSVITYGAWPDPINLIGITILGFGGFWLGFWSFSKGKPIFLDYV